MRFVRFQHSLLLDWNHGNAHGVDAAAQARIRQDHLSEISLVPEFIQLLSRGVGIPAPSDLEALGACGGVPNDNALNPLTRPMSRRTRASARDLRRTTTFADQHSFS